jgi:hypothetical protein
VIKTTFLDNRGKTLEMPIYSSQTRLVNELPVLRLYGYACIRLCLQAGLSAPFGVAYSQAIDPQ